MKSHIAMFASFAILCTGSASAQTRNKTYPDVGPWQTSLVTGDSKTAEPVCLTHNDQGSIFNNRPSNVAFMTSKYFNEIDLAYTGTFHAIFPYIALYFDDHYLYSIEIERTFFDKESNQTVVTFRFSNEEMIKTIMPKFYSSKKLSLVYNSEPFDFDISDFGKVLRTSLLECGNDTDKIK